MAEPVQSIAVNLQPEALTEEQIGAFWKAKVGLDATRIREYLSANGVKGSANQRFVHECERSLQALSEGNPYDTKALTESLVALRQARPEERVLKAAEVVHACLVSEHAAELSIIKLSRGLGQTPQRENILALIMPAVDQVNYPTVTQLSARQLKTLYEGLKRLSGGRAYRGAEESEDGEYPKIGLSEFKACESFVKSLRDRSKQIAKRNRQASKAEKLGGIQEGEPASDSPVGGEAEERPTLPAAREEEDPDALSNCNLTPLALATQEKRGVTAADQRSIREERKATEPKALSSLEPDSPSLRYLGLKEEVGGIRKDVEELKQTAKTMAEEVLRISKAIAAIRGQIERLVKMAASWGLTVPLGIAAASTASAPSSAGQNQPGGGTPQSIAPVNPINTSATPPLTPPTPPATTTQPPIPNSAAGGAAQPPPAAPPAQPPGPPTPPAGPTPTPPPSPQPSSGQLAAIKALLYPGGSRLEAYLDPSQWVNKDPEIYLGVISKVLASKGVKFSFNVGSGEWVNKLKHGDALDLTFINANTGKGANNDSLSDQVTFSVPAGRQGDERVKKLLEGLYKIAIGKAEQGYDQLDLLCANRIRVRDLSGVNHGLQTFNAIEGGKDKISLEALLKRSYVDRSTKPNLNCSVIEKYPKVEQALNVPDPIAEKKAKACAILSGRQSVMIQLERDSKANPVSDNAISSIYLCVDPYLHGTMHLETVARTGKDPLFALDLEFDARPAENKLTADGQRDLEAYRRVLEGEIKIINGNEVSLGGKELKELRDLFFGPLQAEEHLWDNRGSGFRSKRITLAEALDDGWYRMLVVTEKKIREDASNIGKTIDRIFNSDQERDLALNEVTQEEIKEFREKSAKAELIERILSRNLNAILIDTSIAKLAAGIDREVAKPNTSDPLNVEIVEYLVPELLTATRPAQSVACYKTGIKFIGGQFERRFHAASNSSTKSKLDWLDDNKQRFNYTVS